ncbi:MAG: AAA family ATPase [Alphaproteobacteria bacterium]|nr:AAA family ATPase [Alphaproteobacteria bacterium]MBU1515929.1 AAA family ATPase [Alphaproteobacteria bacterium]MBU2094151.1 AAA family ATPase [Alphaproteobacteria bacterium]MBU2151503.1 AAA family ATPase [Alphaproteobacteria bacterium]MBU2305221.1 AAA family ATPase [Alphaproteobacteria bacterium]
MIGPGGAGQPGLAAEPSFMLGGLDVRPTTREVISAEGSEVLEPRVMQVLVALARRQGQVVSRSELIDACWGGRAVGDDAINRCIQAIRRLADKRGGFAVLTVARVGYRLDERGVASADAGDKATASPRPAANERRHLTVLACGLTRAAGVDPEDWYVIARDWRQTASAVARRFGAHVEAGRGDRLIAYFGYPDGLEDAAQRAVRAGLAIAAQQPGLSVRGGIHAGLVVVANDGAEVELFGEAPEIALRALAAAPPGGVAMTGAVHDVVSDVVVAASLGRLASDDGRAQTRLYRVVSAGRAGGRGFAPREATPFVGREDEARLLADRWARVLDGEGRFALVAGEPGIGKTRLVQEFKAGLQGGEHRVIECGGAMLFATSPFHAVVQILQQGLGWNDTDTPAERHAGLEQALASTGLNLDETVPLIGDLLGLPLPAAYAPLTLTPDQRRGRLLASLAAWVSAAAREMPLLLVVEDLQWIDPSSLELLRMLAEQGATSRVMLLCTARPEFQAPWPTRSHHTQLNLAGLAARPMRALVAGLVARAGMTEDLATAVIARADGVPLFAEELTRLMLDGEGNRAPGAIEAGLIPATLLDSLAARLDRLSDGKSVAQLGAVLGRQFSHDLLRAVSPLADDVLQAGLSELADAELIYVRGAAPEATYQFKHALIQDAAYATLLKSRRRELHAIVARAIAARDEDAPEARPEVLAHHWTEAGETEQAVAAWRLAATTAEARNAFSEGQEDCRRAISVLLTLPETASRDALELELGMALARMTTATQGPQSAETARLAARNLVLAEHGHDVGSNTASRILTFSFHVIAAQWRQVAEQADEMAAFAAQVPADTEPRWLRYAQAMAPFTRFNSEYYGGDLRGAEAQFRAFEAFHDGGGYEQRISSTMALSNGAQLACWLGRPDFAAARSAKAQAWAAETGNPYEVAIAGALGALLRVGLGEVDQAGDLAAKALNLADDEGFPQAGGWARVALGRVRAQGGAPGEGIALIRKAIDDLAAIQTRVSMPWFLTWLAEAQALDGQHAEALASLEDALAVNPDERLYRPATLISRGELRARMGQGDLAELDFRAAIEEAGDMGAAGYDLRAATGLARSLSVRGATEEAAAVLRRRLDGPIAGFDTVHVRAARSLDAELSR